ncbi:MAG: hypothetical protein JJU02_11995 [Cryomorphaceae bacterium]|nr:hypothetical protein [Cryomorphaceae bacterium]
MWRPGRTARDCSGSSRAAGGYTERARAERPAEAPARATRSAACCAGLLAEGPFRQPKNNNNEVCHL